MATIRFEGNTLGPSITVEARGGPLIDVCDDVRAPVPFSCRSASCAVCLVEVLVGRELLEPPTEDELELLERVGAPPLHRLACQVIAHTGPGLIRLRSTTDGP